jgi:hypothetical protein
MPKESQYRGYVFWHPKKLVRRRRPNGFLMTFSYTNDYIFSLKKYGKGDTTRFKIVEEIKVSAAEMEKAFGERANNGGFITVVLCL